MEPAGEGGSRFAGVHDTYSAGTPPELQADSSVIGILGWADDETALQRFAILADRPEPFAATSIRFLREGRPGLEIELVAPGSNRRATVRVPIENRLLLPDQAELSPGIHLRPSP